MPPVRLLVTMLFATLPATLAANEPDVLNGDVDFLEEETDFQLGGAATRAAVVPNIIVEEAAAPKARLTLPRSAPETLGTQRETSLGPATLFLGEGLDSGRDAVQMGTFLSAGQARAGISITYLEREAEVSRSELFVDYSLTEQFSVGLSGILNSEIGIDEPVPQLGLSAEYSTDGGAFLQGGVADAADYDPVIGLSVGLRF